MNQLAVVFPGQGSQSVGMMASFAESAVVRNTFAEASDALGQDLWQMVADGPAEALSQTVNTQPVMLTAGIAVWRAWLEAGGACPALVAGHSLGEYAALVAAEVLDFRDAVKLVRFRAEAMQAAVPAGMGGMAAILNLSPELVAEACAEAAQGESVSAANLNSPVQIVIAGHAGAVERAMEACKARGAKRAVALPVSAPFHSTLMKPAADLLAERLASVALSEPKIAVLNNVDVKVETSAESIRDALVRQAYSPVRWIESVEAMAPRGISAVLEFGPGKVLAGLVKRINGELAVEAVTDAEALARVLPQYQ
ncbi:ACP S-malonyltransferase [Uliginosibacterium sp. IMCC34675]|uniref:Malonyl CoA-acyl carrier protein transacylase n=1 Tax=Uliginosibacterium aquaticum TaxID=2731212 RepID=A0ABX2IPN1_9RHOO|nr:ACP S-malonyltransferase [Uliginosibacterium aquaticum]